MTASKSFAWKQVSDTEATWTRPLTAAEDRFDAFHRDTPHAWTDFCAAVTFSVRSGKQQRDVAAYAERAIGHVLLQAPLLMATIEIDGEEKHYAYKALTSVDDLRSRVKTLLRIEQDVQDVDARLEDLSSEYYASRSRVGVELGASLVRFVFVSGRSADDDVGLFLQTTHTMIDFWALASLLELAMDTFARNEQTPTSITPGEDVERLSPAYLEVLQPPLTLHNYNTPTEQDQKHAAEIMGALLSNPLGLRIERAQDEDHSTATASVATMTAHHIFTRDQTTAIVEQAKRHGQSVNQVIQTAHFAALQRVAPVRSDNAVRTHAPSGILNLLPRTTLLKDGKQTRLTPSHQPFMGSVMVPYVCDIGPLLDNAHDGNAFWYVVNEVGTQYKKSASATAPLKAFWDKGPALWGGFVGMLPAVYAGAIPSPPAVYPPLSNAGVLDDGRHMRAGTTYTHDDTTVTLRNFLFYPRVSPLFGAMSWAWTIGGELHTQVVLPDPRVANTPDARRWFATSNEVLLEVAKGAL